MKTLLLGAAFCFFNSHLNAQESAKQMTAWLPSLKAAITVTESTPGNSPHFPNSTWNDVYSLSGQLEGIMGMMHFAEMEHPGTFKFPESYSVPQLLRIVDKFAKEHPENLDTPEIIFVTSALYSQFSIAKPK